MFSISRIIFSINFRKFYIVTHVFVVFAPRVMIMNQSTYLVSIVNATVDFGQADFRQVMWQGVEADEFG